MTPWCNHLRVSLYLVSQHVNRSMSIVVCAGTAWIVNSMNQKKKNTFVKNKDIAIFPQELFRYWHFGLVNVLSQSFSHTVGMVI